MIKSVATLITQKIWHHSRPETPTFSMARIPGILTTSPLGETVNGGARILLVRGGGTGRDQWSAFSTCKALTDYLLNLLSLNLEWKTRTLEVLHNARFNMSLKLFCIFSEG